MRKFPGTQVKVVNSCSEIHEAVLVRVESNELFPTDGNPTSETQAFPNF